MSSLVHLADHDQAPDNPCEPIESRRCQLDAAPQQMGKN